MRIIPKKTKRLLLTMLVAWAGMAGWQTAIAQSNNSGAADQTVPAFSFNIEELMARSENRAPEGATAPSFVIDPTWPKPLPNNWIIGQVGGLSVDADDNIWVYHRPRSLEESSARALETLELNSDNIPIDPLGNPRVMANRIAGCCTPAPSVLKFDQEGNLLAAWGGPQDPGFLENNCLEADGCYWPGNEHGILVDHNNYVYISGNGRNGNGQTPWAASYGNDSHILKFTAEGEFIYQIGYAGLERAGSDDTDGGPNGTPQPFLVADISIDPATNRLYVADGYGNRRVLIIDAETGQYVGHFGAYGQNPVGDSTDNDPIPYNPAPWAAEYRSGFMTPQSFRNPVHCAIVSSDGTLYVCDRSNNRIQVFDLDAANGEACENPGAESGLCGFITEIYIAPQSAAGTAVDATLSSDDQQSCLYVGDLANGVFYIIDRENYSELDRIGRRGRHAGEFHWLHALDTDSEGNVYTGEVDSGPRIQKFTRYGERGCSGAGFDDIGAYARNR